MQYNKRKKQSAQTKNCFLQHFGVKTQLDKDGQLRSSYRYFFGCYFFETILNFEPEEAFIVERQKENESDDYYEEPDSSRDFPELYLATVLKDITNTTKQEYPPPQKRKN